MADGTDQGELAPDRDPLARWQLALANAVRAAGPPLLFGLRLWAAVCLALYVAFWLELDNAYWAGTSAALVCQPHLGASLRKGWFRMIGTLVGAVVIVVLSGLFPQNRFGFLVSCGLARRRGAPFALAKRCGSAGGECNPAQHPTAAAVCRPGRPNHTLDGKSKREAGRM
jgi:hypothetical protein